MSVGFRTCGVTEPDLRADGCQIVDVREYSEFAALRVAGARLAPLSALEQHAGVIDRARPVYLMCRSGNRGRQAAARLGQMGFAGLVVIDGGMQAWAAAGLPVETGASRVWSLERQVRFTTGLLALAGVLLAWLVHPWLIALSGLMGAGLMFSAVTDTCGMGMVLAKMPWNQQPADQAGAVRARA
ncbi:MAG: rhodanese-like domain-containing protein [Blastocatellia bacterium]